MSPTRPGRHGRSRMAAMLAGSVVLAALAVASWCGAAFGAGVTDPRSTAFEPPVSEGGDFTTVAGTNFENGIPADVVPDRAASSGGAPAQTDTNAASTSGSLLDRPDIILILSDDQTMESVQKMPYLRSQVPPQGGWYSFDHAFINTAVCCPSRATILTGLWSHHHGVEGTGGAPPYDDSDTIASRLHAIGYRTGYVGKYHLGSSVTNFGPTSIPPGWDTWQAYVPNPGGWYY